jgi:LPS export ABC transporter protein LptC
MTAGLSEGRLIKIPVVFVCLLVLLGACKNDPKKVEELTSLSKKPSELGKKLQMFYSDSAVLKVKVITPYMQKFEGEDPYMEFPKGIEVYFYNDNKKVETQLTANYAVNYENKEFMEARKDVVVVNEKGETLNTEHLMWDKKKRMIFSESFVKITTADEVIFGDGLEANESFTRYKIKKIKGTINLKDES